MSNEQQYYDDASLWATQQMLNSPEQMARLNIAAKMIPSGIKTLLDVGTGTGEFLYLLEQENTGLILNGIERAKSARELAVCKTELMEGDITKLPLPDRSFGLVSALEVIEHLPYEAYEQGLEELERVSSRYILIMVPYKERRRKTRCAYCDCLFDPSYHMRTFSERTMEKLFSKCALKKLEKVYVDTSIPNRFFGGLLKYFPTTNLPFALCPQCGFSHRFTSTDAAPRSKQSVFSRIEKLPAKLIPIRTRIPRWIAGLYERCSGD